MPINFSPKFPFLVTGNPQNPCSSFNRKTSETYKNKLIHYSSECITSIYVHKIFTNNCGDITTGSRINPCLYFFTLSTSLAW